MSQRKEYVFVTQMDSDNDCVIFKIEFRGPVTLNLNILNQQTHHANTPGKS